MSFMIIRRYILSELFQSFIISLVGLNLVLMMEKLIRLSRLLTGLGATVSDFLMVIVFVQPQLMLLSLPMALLLSVLVTYGRLSLDNEIMILRTSGLRKTRLYEPVFIFSTVVLLMSFLVSLYLMPVALKTLRRNINTIVKRRAPLAIEPGVFFDAFNGLTLLIKKKDRDGTLKDIFLYDSRNKKNSKVITAREAFVVPDKRGVVFRLKHGMIHIVRGYESTEFRFSEYIFRLNLSGSVLSKRKNEMTLKELLDAIKRRPYKSNDYFIELHRRFTFPLMIVVIAFLAPSLSMISGKTGRAGGFFIALIVFLAYYTMLIYFENLVRTQKAPHLVCWLPLIVFSTSAYILYRRVGE